MFLNPGATRLGIIDHTIAIIIDAVTDFWLTGLYLAEKVSTVCATQHPLRTGQVWVDETGGVLFLERLIHSTVTIIVEVITPLNFSPPRSTEQLSCFTRPGALVANAKSARFTSSPQLIRISLTAVILAALSVIERRIHEWQIIKTPASIVGGPRGEDLKVLLRHIIGGYECSL